LYPRLKESEAAAAQLAAALWGRPVSPEERQRSLILLVENMRDSLSCIHIDAQGLRPIAQAVRWQCALDVDPPAQAVATGYATLAREEFLSRFEQDFEVAIEVQRNQRIAVRCQQLQEQLEPLVKRAEQLEQINSSLTSALDGVVRLTAVVPVGVKDLGKAVKDLWDAVDGPLPPARKLGLLVEEYQRQVALLETLQGEIAKLRKNL
jgi:hypothetical protein